MLQALIPSVTNEALFTKTAQDLLHSLRDRGILHGKEALRPFNKIAGRRCPNPNHPVVITYAALQELDGRCKVVEEMAKVAQEHLCSVHTALRGIYEQG